MKLEIKVPQAGESITEGDIAKWFKKSGDFVVMDEPLLELETDKATLEITAEADGQLEILADEGTTVKVGQVIGNVEKNAKNEASGRDLIEQDQVEEEGGLPVSAEDFGKDEFPNPPHTMDVSVIAKGNNTSSPAARKLMLEHKVSSDDITDPTGKDRRITKQDVLKFIEARRDQEVINASKHKYEFYNSDAPVVSPDETVTLFRHPPHHGSTDSTVNRANTDPVDSDGLEGMQRVEDQADSELPPSTSNGESRVALKRSVRREKLTRLRKTVSHRLVDAQKTAALLTTFNEVDMTEIQSTRRKYKEQFKEKHNIGLGLMSFFTKAACQALQQFPIINAQMEKGTILFFDYCDIGIAVATPRGLVVPILRNAESMALHEIEKGIIDLADKAKNSNLSLDDLNGGTFTITNGGIYGSMLSTPIVNSPQSAILGMHNIVERPVAVDGKVVIRPIMYLALTYDHRLIDGADAVQFLRKVKTLCENPIKLILNL